MLEGIAVHYINQPDINLLLIGCATVVIGAIVAGIFNNGTAELQRAPYFACSGILFFIMSLSQLVWFGSVAALIYGFVWIFMLVDVVVGFAVGYAFGIIAMARSRDAFGHSWMAVLAFVPIANLWLLFAPTKYEASAYRAPTIRLLTGDLGILIGFVFLVAGNALGAFIETESARMVENAEDDPAVQHASIKMLLHTKGLEATLQQLASEVPSERIDETKTLLGVEAEAATLRYVYRVEGDEQELPAYERRDLIDYNCALEAISPLIDAGATIEHFYARSDGIELSTVTITQAVCENPEPGPSPSLDESEISDIIDTSPVGAMYRALKSYFPEEAEFFMTRMSTLLNGGASTEEAFSKMRSVGAEIRRRHSANLLTAPDLSLVSVLLSQREIIAAFDDDPEQCNRVVMFGSEAIPETESRRINALMDSAGLLYRAMHEGVQSPVQRAQATADDWDNLISDFYTAGGTENDLDLVIQLDFQNPRLCGAMQLFMLVLKDADFPGADRVRAELVAAMMEA